MAILDKTVEVICAGVVLWALYAAAYAVFSAIGRWLNHTHEGKNDGK